jgi:hypothetical protein
LAIPTLKQIGVTNQVAEAYSQLGSILQAQRRLDLSESKFRDGIAYVEREGKPDQSADLRSGLSATLILKGQYDQAVSEINIAMETHLRVGDKRGLAIDYSNLARAT